MGYSLDAANALHAHEKELRSIKIKDADSLCKYIQGFFEFIYNHKMFGCVWDIYADEIVVHRENGYDLKGIEKVEQNIMALCSAFSDLRIHVATCFAAPENKDAYRVWMRYYLTGTNNAPSIYGPATGNVLEKDKSLCISSFLVKKIDDEWLITDEIGGKCSDYIRYVCTGDKSFTALKFD